MHNDNLKEATVKPTLRRRFYGRLSRKARLRVLGIALLVAGALGAAALNHVVPSPPSRVKGVTGRLVWYVQDGCLKADMHTLASMIKYIAASESERPSAAVPTNLPIAGDVPPTSPRS